MSNSNCNCNWPDLDDIAQLPTLEPSSGTLNFNNNHNNHNHNPPMMPSSNNHSMWNLNSHPSSSTLIDSRLEEDYYTPTLLINNLNLFPAPLITSFSTNPPPLTLDTITNAPLQVINPSTSSSLHQAPHHGTRPPHQIEGGGGEGEEKQQQGYMFLVKSEVDVLYDGYCWRKYGEKKIKNRIHPRSYYKCAHDGCNILKQVERSTDDPTVVCTTYYGCHTHEATTKFFKIF